MFIPLSIMRDVEGGKLTQGKILVELNRHKTAAQLRDCEFGIFSQWGEDGVIQKLIASVPIANCTFIEFGVEDFVESNCRFLMMNDNWRGYVIDGSSARIAALRKSPFFWKHDLAARCAVVTRDNVNELLLASGFDRDLGLLSIDVDGVDYWLLEALDAYSPRILIVEYNALFGKDRKITVPYDDRFARRKKHYSDLYFGASLAALACLAGRKGYSLVHTERAGVNAFFVRNDLLGGDLCAVSPSVAFTESMVRQSRDAKGRLNFLGLDERYAAIRGMPVVNVETGLVEEF